MRIFYIPGFYPFCYYYRGYLPGVYSNQTVVTDFITNGNYSAEKYIEEALKADVIVFQRPTTRSSVELVKLLKQKGKKIIFDNDDTYSGIPLHRLGNEKRIKIAQEQNEILNEFLRLADGATTSTELLKEEYGKINLNIAVLKNCIDPLDEFPCKKNETGKFRVGLIGSVTSNDDYFHIKEDLKKLHDRDDVTLVIMGAGKHADGAFMKAMKEDQDFWNSLPKIEWHPNCHTNEYYMKVADLALDLAIIPRKDHYFNKCKSNLKFLDMSLLSIPVLAQSFPARDGPYEGPDEPYLTLTKNWYEKIIEIKENYPKYKEKALKAHDYVLREYNITNYAHTWQEEIEKLCRYQKTS